MHESSKSIFHKLKDSRYATRYLIGDGIDIGAGPDCIAQYHEFFPLMRSCRAWDKPDCKSCSTVAQEIDCPSEIGGEA